MSDFTMHAPIEMMLQVMIINDENKQTGTVKIGVGSFTYPTIKKQIELLKAFEDNELTEQLSGFRLMTKREAWDHKCQEMSGDRFALPGGSDWDTPDTELQEAVQALHSEDGCEYSLENDRDHGVQMYCVNQEAFERLLKAAGMEV